MALSEIGRNFTSFPNGATVLDQTISDGATPPTLSHVITITPGWQQVQTAPPVYDDNGDVIVPAAMAWEGPNLPPGYVANDPRWPSAEVVAAPAKPGTQQAEA